MQYWHFVVQPYQAGMTQSSRADRPPRFACLSPPLPPYCQNTLPRRAAWRLKLDIWQSQLFVISFQFRSASTGLASLPRSSTKLDIAPNYGTKGAHWKPYQARTDFRLLAQASTCSWGESNPGETALRIPFSGGSTGFEAAVLWKIGTCIIGRCRAGCAHFYQATLLWTRHSLGHTTL